jgi:hypothetical protein
MCPSCDVVTTVRRVRVERLERGLVGLVSKGVGERRKGFLRTRTDENGDNEGCLCLGRRMTAVLSSSQHLSVITTEECKDRTDRPACCDALSEWVFDFSGAEAVLFMCLR